MAAVRARWMQSHQVGPASARIPQALVAVAGLIACVAAGCGGPGAKGGLSATYAVGSAYVPLNVSAGTTTALSYRESGGAVTRLALKLLTSNPGINTRSTSSSTSSTSCTAYVCTTTIYTTTTTVVTDSPEVVAQKVENVRRLHETIDRSELPIDFRLDIAMRSLGGDTSGWMAVFMYQGELRETSLFAGIQLSGGLGFGKYKFHERTQTQLSPSLMGVEQMLPEVGYTYFGLPLRITAALGRRGLRSYLQADLNLITFAEGIGADEDDAPPPSPIHWGLGYRRGVLRLEMDFAFGRMRASGMTAALEAGLVF